MRYKPLVIAGYAVSFTLAFTGEPALGQILPPFVEPPTTIALPPPPPTGNPATTAPSAAGPFLATPAWNQTFPPNLRFVILTNFNSQAVLDRETGLVWARQVLNNGGVELLWGVANFFCSNLVIANRGGWRLPRVAELATLVDYSVPESSLPRLPSGHPLVLPTFTIPYWSSESRPLTETFYYVRLSNGITNSLPPDHTGAALCVRGP